MSRRFAIIHLHFWWSGYIGNLDSDPEEFVRTLCDDLNITDPEVGVCFKS